MRFPAILTAIAALASSVTAIQLKTSDHVVVVGGGPAGVHYASLLAKKGVKKITLLEASDAVGGKSLTLVDNQGTAQEMGTIFALDTYTPIFDLAKEYDPTNAKIPSALESPGYMNFLGESVGAKDNDPSTRLDFPRYLARNLRLNAPPALRENATIDQLHDLVKDQAKRYFALHRSIFGAYPYGMPPQPKNWTLIDMSALEFLQVNNLTALTGMLRFTQEVQGYGILETIPAFYFLWWSHPEPVSKILQAELAGTHSAYIFKEGFQRIWKAIAQAHRSNVKTVLNAKVTHVSRGLKTGKKPSVSYTRGNNKFTIDCDHVVMAVDLSVYAGIIDDLTDDEKTLFTTGYTASTFITSLFESKASPAEASGLIWQYRMIQGGRVIALRNSKLMFTFNGTSTSWGDLVLGRQNRVAYQYYDRPLSQVDQAATKSLLFSDLKLAGLDDAAVWTTRPFNYFPRFTPEALKAGLLWKIWDIQGKQRTTWIGSSVSFESVLDVVTYNNRLIQRVDVV